MNKKIGIVILNYKNYIDTMECVNSIKNQDYYNYEIIIVDNYSQNESIKKLKEYIGNQNNIKLIESDKNLGFACGNNLGIKYARERLKCDFVFVLNSDTIFYDKNTLTKLLSNYEENKQIGLINPMCYNKNGDIQRPYLICNKSVLQYFFKITTYLIGMWGKKFLKINKSVTKKKKLSLDTLQDNKYIIQGCSYVLTPDYFKYYDEIFPKTFLYFEELALCIYLDKAKLNTIIDEEVYILHKEGGASDEVVSERKLKYQTQSYFRIFRLMFMNKNSIKKIK